MTAVYFVNVLSLLIIRIPRVPGANINEVPNSEKFSHSAGGPQLELRWGPGRAKRARARHTYTKTRKTAKSHLFSELGEMLGNTGFSKKKKKQRNLEGKKKPTLFTRPFCKCRPQIRADSIFSPAFFPRLVEPWLNHGNALGNGCSLIFFLPAAPFFIFCSAKKGSLSGSVV